MASFEFHKRRIKTLEEESLKLMFTLEATKMLWRCAVISNNGEDESKHRNKILELTSVLMDLESHTMIEHKSIRNLM